MITLNNNFKVNSPAPLDNRSVQPTKALALSNITGNQRYRGLLIYILNENKFYIFKNGISDFDFVEFSTETISNDTVEATSGTFEWVTDVDPSLFDETGSLIDSSVVIAPINNPLGPDPII
jgi:hypothetical protein